MIIHLRKLILFLSLFFGFVPSTQPISQNAVYAGTFGTGLGVGLLSYKIAGKSLIVGAIAAAGSGFIAYQILSQFTAEGRLARARVKFDYMSRSYFSSHEFDSEELFFNAVQEVYVLSDLPLMTAYNDLAYYIAQGYEALSLLDAAKSESNFDLNIIQQCDVLIPRIHRALSLMTESVKRIRSSSEYIKQVKIYKEMQAAKEKLAVQQQLANSQNQIAHAQTQMAHAQMHQAYNR